MSLYIIRKKFYSTHTHKRLNQLKFRFLKKIISIWCDARENISLYMKKKNSVCILYLGYGREYRRQNVIRPAHRRKSWGKRAPAKCNYANTFDWLKNVKCRRNTAGYSCPDWSAHIYKRGPLVFMESSLCGLRAPHDAFFTLSIASYAIYIAIYTLYPPQHVSIFIIYLRTLIHQRWNFYINAAIDPRQTHFMRNYIKKENVCVLM